MRMTMGNWRVAWFLRVGVVVGVGRFNRLHRGGVRVRGAGMGIVGHVWSGGIFLVADDFSEVVAGVGVWERGGGG